MQSSLSQKENNETFCKAVQFFIETCGNYNDIIILTIADSWVQLGLTNSTSYVLMPLCNKGSDI